MDHGSYWVFLPWKRSHFNEIFGKWSRPVTSQHDWGATSQHSQSLHFFCWPRLQVSCVFFSNEPQKTEKTACTFHESSWWLNRDPYVLVYQNNSLHIPGSDLSSPYKYPKQPAAQTNNYKIPVVEKTAGHGHVVSTHGASQIFYKERDEYVSKGKDHHV